MRTTKRVASGLAAVLALGSVTMIAAGAAQASANTVHLYGQINNNSLSGNEDLSGGLVVTMTVAPTSAYAGTPLEVKVSTPSTVGAGGIGLCNGPAAQAPAGEEEADAVVVLNGTQYVLHGPRNKVNVPSSPHASSIPPACAHTLFNPGWVISSTTGHSSATSDTAASPATAGTGTTTYNHTTGAMSVAVALKAPTAVGSYTVGLKALVVNAIAGTSTPSLYDDFDEMINIDSTGTCGNPAACPVDNTTYFPGPGGTPDTTSNPGSLGNGSFYNDTAGDYISAAAGWTPLTFTVAKDTTKPVATLTVPSKPTHGSSWKTIKGKVTDKGTGPKAVYVQLLDKKSGKYYAWTGKKWTKKTSKAKALAAAKKLAATPSSSGAWSVKGAKPPKKTTLTVSYYATDKSGNTSTKKAYSKSITA